jgi:hypothetical protein
MGWGSWAGFVEQTMSHGQQGHFGLVAESKFEFDFIKMGTNRRGGQA